MSIQTGTHEAYPSLTAATAVAPGLVIDLGQVYSNPVMQVATNGAVAAGVVVLEGSLDGTTFYTVGTSAPLTAADVAVANAGGVTIPARFVRANITTLVTGGTITCLMGAGA